MLQRVGFIGLGVMGRDIVPLPGAAQATQLYLNARAYGEGDKGNQALFRVYDRLSNQED